MSYLIDTNVLLWAMEGNPKLSSRAKAAINNEKNDIYVSVVSIWEISIKLSIGKLKLSRTLDEIIDEIDYLNFSLKPISLDALRLVRNFPFHHRDPFDRLIIAEAQIEKIPIISSDEKFHLYPPEIIW